MAYDDNHEYAGHYYPAIERYKMENARKGKAQRWIAEDQTRSSVVEFIFAGGSNFINKMGDAFSQWGSLTAGQEAAVRKIMAANEARKAEFKAQGQASQFIGTIGKREAFRLVLTGIYQGESDYGFFTLYNFKDEKGNLVAWKSTGSAHHGLNKGSTYEITGTVKAHHTNQEGINKTYLSRCKVTADYSTLADHSTAIAA